MNIEEGEREDNEYDKREEKIEILRYGGSDDY